MYFFSVFEGACVGAVAHLRMVEMNDVSDELLNELRTRLKRNLRKKVFLLFMHITLGITYVVLSPYTVLSPRLSK